MITHLRTMLAISAASLILAACSTVPSGAMPPPGLNWFVTSVLNGFYDDIDDPTNRPPLLTQPPAGIVRAVDINQDGVNDWIVEWPTSSQFCGTGGCRVTVYLTHGQNLIRIFDRQALDKLAFSMVDGEGRIESQFHHTVCRGAGETCRLAWGLDPAQRRLVARPSSTGDAFATRSSEDPIDRTWSREG